MSKMTEMVLNFLESVVIRFLWNWFLYIILDKRFPENAYLGKF